MIRNYTKVLPGSKPKNEPKYHNVKVTIDGIPFQSTKEGLRYSELREQLRIGLISNLELQPMFILQEKFIYQSKSERAIKYIADFKYIKNGKECIEYVKGKKTAQYLIKRKLLLYKYPCINFIET
jgi:hypothetical protein